MSCHCKLSVFSRLLRRCQALLLSHQGATGQELEPYLQHVMKPLAPLTLYGRYAKTNPPCHKEECVYYFWQDRRCFEVSREQLQLFVLRVSHCALAQGHVFFFSCS